MCRITALSKKINNVSLFSCTARRNIQIEYNMEQQRRQQVQQNSHPTTTITSPSHHGEVSHTIAYSTSNQQTLECHHRPGVMSASSTSSIFGGTTPIGVDWWNQATLPFNYNSPPGQPPVYSNMWPQWNYPQNYQAPFQQQAQQMADLQNNQINSNINRWSKWLDCFD